MRVLRKAFKTIDLDNDGRLDRTELKRMLEKIDDQVDEQFINQVMMIADSDKDGKLDFEEFVRAIRSIA